MQRYMVNIVEYAECPRSGWEHASSRVHKEARGKGGQEIWVADSRRGNKERKDTVQGPFFAAPNTANKWCLSPISAASSRNNFLLIYFYVSTEMHSKATAALGINVAVALECIAEDLS